MALWIQKFGGSSLATLSHIQSIADKIIATKRLGYSVVVVVSAMQGETNRLIKLAADMMPNPNPREYAMLVVTGEQAAMSLMSMALLQKGYKACSLTAFQAGIYTDISYQHARIRHVDTRLLQRYLQENVIPVVAGFQGITEIGEVTTLGRGGSDMTAVALAANLQAQECRIYTDVAGVHTADPRLVTEAKLIQHIAHLELLELTKQGARIMQYEAMQLASRYRVPLHILSSFMANEEGTKVHYNDSMEGKRSLCGIASHTHGAVCYLTGLSEPPLSASQQILNLFAQQGAYIELLTPIGVEGSVTNQLGFLINKDHLQQAIVDLGRCLISYPGAQIRYDNRVAVVTLVGTSLDKSTSLIQRLLATLFKKNINTQWVIKRSLSIAFVLPEDHINEAIRVLHNIVFDQATNNEAVKEKIN